MDTRAVPNISRDEGSGTAVDVVTFNLICSRPKPPPASCARVIDCPWDNDSSVANVNRSLPSAAELLIEKSEPPANASVATSSVPSRSKSMDTNSIVAGEEEVKEKVIDSGPSPPSNASESSSPPDALIPKFRLESPEVPVRLKRPPLGVAVSVMTFPSDVVTVVVPVKPSATSSRSDPAKFAAPDVVIAKSNVTNPALRLAVAMATQITARRNRRCLCMRI